MASSSDTLKGIFAPGDTVPVILRHVSRSGVRRTIDVLNPHNLQSLASEVSEVLDLRRDPERIGVIVSRNDAMNMFFSLVYDLGLSLYGDGYAFSYKELLGAEMITLTFADAKRRTSTGGGSDQDQPIDRACVSAQLRSP